MMVPKGITLLEHTSTFNKDIREWRRQTPNLKTCDTFKTFPHQAHREKRREITTAGKGGYAATVKNIYGVPPPPPEDHLEEIENLNTIVQGMQTHI